MWKSSRRIALFSTVLALGGATLAGVVVFTDWLPVELHEPDTGRLAQAEIPDDLSWASIDDVAADSARSGTDESYSPAVDDTGTSAPTGFGTRVERFAQADNLPPASFDDHRESYDVDGRFPDQFPDYGSSSRPAVSSNAAPGGNVSIAASSDLLAQPGIPPSNFSGGPFREEEPFRNPPARRSVRDAKEVAPFPAELPRNQVTSDDILLTAATSTDQQSADSAASTGDATQQPVQTGSEPSADVPASDDARRLVSNIATLLANGEYIAAHREMSNIYWRQPELRPLIMRQLEENAATIYFNPQPHFLEPYELQPGDLLQRVAPKYSLSWQYLARLNRISDPGRIRAGQKLKVIKGPFSAFVDLSDFELTVHAHGFVVKRYTVGIGRDGSSPVGRFKVLEKIPTPQYTDPDGRVIAGGAPDNPLGPFWIDLGDSYGIHGTIDPQSIGKAESRGCIRMHNEEVAEVYDFLVTGSEVVIRP